MVYNDYKDWGWEPFVRSWIGNTPLILLSHLSKLIYCSYAKIKRKEVPGNHLELFLHVLKSNSGIQKSQLRGIGSMFRTEFSGLFV